MYQAGEVKSPRAPRTPRTPKSEPAAVKVSVVERMWVSLQLLF